jgi:hypothetical protein
MPEEDCLGQWRHSVRVSDSTDEAVTDEGFFDIFLDASGNLVGQHVLDPSTKLDLWDVTCDPGPKHHRIAFTRKSADGTFECEYKGKVVFDGSDFIIQQGRFKSKQTVAVADDPGDNGDWSAEKPGA